jgi:hypothetical protein
VLFEVIPSAPLAERTSYELFVAERDERGVTPRRASTFRTGRRSATAFDDWTGPQERSETTKTLGRASSTQEWLRVSAVNGAIPLVELEIEQAEGVPEFLYVGPRGRIWNGVACACEGDFHRSESGAWEFAARPISARGERGPEWKGGWDTQQLYVVGPPKWVLVAVVAAVGVAVTALGRWLWRRGRKDQG